MARFVKDLGLTLAIIAGVDWRDSAVIPMPHGDPSIIALKGLRCAFYTYDGNVLPTPETMDTVRATAQVLADAGLIVEEARPRGIEASREITQRYWGMSKLAGFEVKQLLLDWDGFRSAMLSFIEHYDVIICPADYCPASPHSTRDEIRFSYTLPYSLTGWPCVVVRAGTSPEGLPIGVQVVARPWREDVALAVAQHIETALGGWLRPPL
jgi:amidase